MGKLLNSLSNLLHRSTRYSKSLGPVRDLEKYVQKDWWKHIFDEVYLMTDGDVVNDPKITKEEVDIIIQALELKQDDRVLDLCCGHGRHALELARRSFKNVEGLDISKYLISLARKRASEEGLNVKFTEGDARHLPYPNDYFDAVLILGNSFGYFEDIKDDVVVLKEVHRVLKQQGKILIDLTNGDYIRQNYEPRSWEWIDNKHFVCRERTLSKDGRRLLAREIVVNVDNGVLADQFYGVRLYSFDEIKSLLLKVGFTDVKLHKTLSTVSDRGQDMGMMGNRLIVSARKCARSQSSYSPVEELKTIVVLLGDPRKPDPVKPNGVFDDDDMFAIDELKKALSCIDGYRFVYLNDHEKMVEELMKMRDSIHLVLNLCDEGYMNDPFKELHVPALLDMLGIPYTGAGPRCLAYCYDKSFVKSVAKDLGIPTPKSILVKELSDIDKMQLEFPAIVKPNFGDNSYGITYRNVVKNENELIKVLSWMRECLGYKGPVLLEEYIEGDDLSVGIIGNLPDDYLILPIIKEDYSQVPVEFPRICSYEAKWLKGTPYDKVTSTKIDLPESTRTLLEKWCLLLFERLECRDYARFDWRLSSENVPKLLEVNPNPGWVWDGHLNKMANLAGISYSELLHMIILSAEKRLKLKKYLKVVEKQENTPPER
ncbi:MAG: methyltransferase domain-containing protein [Nitrososphaerota archaeon]|nr:methyltransferase domain-containing protein [Aigarchaeota archaeon]MDW8076645.1 methyltransferase domain-containing protein [Nitrososphaerota archaeon]